MSAMLDCVTAKGVKRMKTKLTEWENFFSDVYAHIDKYCIPQYGDYPDEMIDKMDTDDIKFQIERYAGRIGRGARGEEEALRDCFKIAHYACLLHSKIKG